MTAIWLVVWLLSHTPGIVFSPNPNGWATWLLITVALDLAAAHAD